MRDPSFWFTSVGGYAPTRPPLAGPCDVDVCIVGGGFTGLWTAYELRRADPSLEVIVLEREAVGFGASGRNGGWVVGEIAGSRARWLECGGPTGLAALHAAIRETVDEIGAVVAAETIDCDWVKGGSLHVAQTPVELQRLRAAGDDGGLLLDADELRARVRVRGGLGARFTEACARIQPVKLVRGLADAAERRGATIYEQTAVTSIEPHLARTATGDVRAKVVVCATEAYTAELPHRRRELVPVNSSMIVTEPLESDAWTELGWERAETILDGAHLYAYLQRTADGRIAIGGRGVPYRFGSRTSREGPVPKQTVEQLRRRLVQLFGAAADLPIAGAWHGVLGVSRDWAPSLGIDRRTGIAWAGGYAGEGVAASNLAARTLRDLILERETALTALPWVGRRSRQWEPEPLRFAGIRGVHALFGAADRIEARTGRASALATVANRISGRS